MSGARWISERCGGSGIAQDLGRRLSVIQTSGSLARFGAAAAWMLVEGGLGQRRSFQRRLVRRGLGEAPRRPSFLLDRIEVGVVSRLEGRHTPSPSSTSRCWSPIGPTRRLRPIGQEELAQFLLDRRIEVLARRRSRDSPAEQARSRPSQSWRPDRVSRAGRRRSAGDLVLLVATSSTPLATEKGVGLMAGRADGLEAHGGLDPLGREEIGHRREPKCPTIGCGSPRPKEYFLAASEDATIEGDA